jgi:hypothetical protein
MQARRGVGGQLEDRLAVLIAELLAHGGEQPLAAVAGMACRQPPAGLSGIDRPHVPDLVAFYIDDPDQFAAPHADGLSGLGGDSDRPVCGL